MIKLKLIRKLKSKLIGKYTLQFDTKISHSKVKWKLFVFACHADPIISISLVGFGANRAG